jgi:hypothetical protein
MTEGSRYCILLFSTQYLFVQPDRSIERSDMQNDHLGQSYDKATETITP